MTTPDAFRRDVRWYAAAAVLVGALFAWVLTAPLGRAVVLVVDNGGQLGASAAAAVACLRAGRRGEPHQQRTWLLLGTGVGCWAAGQAVWSFYEVVLGREVPFPSWADVGFLLFPVVASAGLLSWLSVSARAAARARDVLDGAIIAGSLLVLSWCTTLGSVYAAGGENRLSFALSLAYPVGDVVMATLVLLTLARAKARQRGVLLAVAAGLGGLAVADSAYVYLVTVDAYASGSLISAGWVVGFLLITAGALGNKPTTDSDLAHREVPAAQGLTVSASRLPMLLPYLPLVAAQAVVIGQVFTSTEVPTVSVALGFALVALVLARQLLALTENHRLLVELGTVRDRLRRQALHDGLTGLPNRTLFTERVQHALSVSPRPERGVAVLFCDLDDFKIVNDELGHEAGDALLCQVADRLRGSLRPDDTVARLGGDEFAVLLEDAGEAFTVAARLIDVAGRPCVLDGVSVQVSLSVGVARCCDLETDDGPSALGALSPSEQVRRLLRAADRAMYLAKAAGKGQAVLATAPAEAGVPAGSAMKVSVADQAGW